MSERWSLLTLILKRSANRLCQIHSFFREHSGITIDSAIELGLSWDENRIIHFMRERDSFFYYRYYLVKQLQKCHVFLEEFCVFLCKCRAAISVFSAIGWSTEFFAVGSAGHHWSSFSATSLERRLDTFLLPCVRPSWWLAQKSGHAEARWLIDGSTRRFFIAAFFI